MLDRGRSAPGRAAMMLAALVALAFALSGCRAAPTLDARAELAAESPPAVLIAQTGWFGTALGSGSILRSDARGTFVLTASHVVDGWGGVQVLIPRAMRREGRGEAGFDRVDARVLARDRNVESYTTIEGGPEGDVVDLALLRLETARVYRALSLADGPSDEGWRPARAAVYRMHAGAPSGRLALIDVLHAPVGGAEGTIDMVVPVRAYQEVREGMSGGAIVADGRQVGLLFALTAFDAKVRRGAAPGGEALEDKASEDKASEDDDEDEDARRVAVALPARVIRRWLEQQGHGELARSAVAERP